MFLVEIRYREPTYETRHGTRTEPYRWRYRVAAASEKLAVRLAVDEFRRMEAISAVGWSRDIVAVEAVIAMPSIV